MLKIRRPLGRLIFNMGIAIPGKTVFLIETAPRGFSPAVRSKLLDPNENGEAGLPEASPPPHHWYPKLVLTTVAPFAMHATCNMTQCVTILLKILSSTQLVIVLLYKTSHEIYGYNQCVLFSFDMKCPSLSQMFKCNLEISAVTCMYICGNDAFWIELKRIV